MGADRTATASPRLDGEGRGTPRSTRIPESPSCAQGTMQLSRGRTPGTSSSGWTTVGRSRHPGALSTSCGSERSTPSGPDPKLSTGSRRQPLSAEGSLTAASTADGEPHSRRRSRNRATSASSSRSAVSSAAARATSSRRRDGTVFSDSIRPSRSRRRGRGDPPAPSPLGFVDPLHLAASCCRAVRLYTRRRPNSSRRTTGGAVPGAFPEYRPGLIPCQRSDIVASSR